MDADTISSMTKQSINLGSLSDGDYSGFSVNGNTITITGTDNYEISGSLNGTNGKIIVDGNAVISLSGDVSGKMDITVNSGKDAVLLIPPYTNEGLGFAVETGKLELMENSTLTVKFDPDSYDVLNTGLECDNIQMNTGSTLNIEGSTVHCTSSEPFGKTEGASDTTINLYYDLDNYSGASLFGNKLDVNNVVLSSGTLELTGEDANVSDETVISVKDGSRILSSSSDEEDGYHMTAQYLVEVTKADPDVIWIQAGANSGQGISIDTLNASASALGFKYFSVLSHENAGKAINTIHNAIETVSSYRSYYGAMHNRLEHALSVDQNTAENLQYAESRIRDADMAEEMLEYSKSDVLNNAAMAMMAQANQQPEGILKILQ